MARTKAKPKIDTAGGTQPAATSPDVVYGQGVENIAAQDPTPVSYTHLTLPTIYPV